MSSDADADADPDPDSSDASGYVHTPGEPDAVESDAGESDSTESTAGATATAGAATDQRPSETDEFGRAGWVLTGMLIVCMLIIPGIIYLYPYFLGSFGLSFFSTYLVLPLIPAAVLGLVAVWSMTAAVHED